MNRFIFVVLALTACFYEPNYGERTARAREFEQRMGIRQGACAHITTYVDCNGLVGGRPARYRCFENRCRWLGADE